MYYPVVDNVSKCFVFDPCFIGRFYNSGNECSWTNTEQLVFTKPCPHKGFMKTWKYVFQTFQFRLNSTGTKPQFAEIFRYYITKAEIIQNRGFRSTLNDLSTALNLVHNFFLNLSISNHILLNFAIFHGGALSKSMQIPKKRIETVGNHVRTVGTC